MESFGLLKLALDAHLSVYKMDVNFQQIRFLPDNEKKQKNRADRLIKNQGAVAAVWIDFNVREVSLSYDDGESDGHYLRQEFDCIQSDFAKCVDAIASSLASAISSWAGNDLEHGSNATVEPIYAHDNEISPLKLTNAGWQRPEPVLDLFVQAGFGPLFFKNNLASVPNGPHLSVGTVILSRLLLALGFDLYGTTSVVSNLDENEKIRIFQMNLTTLAGAVMQMGRFSFQPAAGLTLELYSVREEPDSAEIVNAADVRAGICMMVAWRLELLENVYLWLKTGGNIYFEQAAFRVEHTFGSEETLLEHGTFQSRVALGLEYVFSIVEKTPDSAGEFPR